MKNAIALGTFDGVHKGHRAVLDLPQGYRKTAVTFVLPPKAVLTGERALITTTEDKCRILKNIGMDDILLLEFASVKDMSPQAFLEFLKEKYNPELISCGFNYRFGRGGIGDVEMLASLCRKHGLSLSVVPPVALGGTTVSSSEIRSALERGDIERANLLLGRPYSLCAKVIDGQHLGRSLGFPTVNQVFDPRKQLPPYGVYASRVCIGGALRYGITNVGMRPTVGGTLLCAETNIFDFDGDLYGKTLTVELISFIRPEKKFDSVDSLSAQVHADIARAKEIFKFK